VRHAHDAETRDRLLEVGTRLFGERGYSHVTVRDICREADANVAAVNYYFGGKLGLYTEIVQALVGSMREADPTTAAPAGSSAEERIRHYVRTYVPRIAKPRGQAVWGQKLMGHETHEPTPLAPWIAEQVILPRVRYLSEAVAELLGCATDDPRVGRSVASLQAQCLFYLPSRFRSTALHGWDAMVDAEVDAIAEHIAEFTLAGIARLAGAGSREGRR
jgi:AcrR family transcriptional regulator